MIDTSDIRHDFILTYTRNHDSYMTGVSLDSQREYYGGVFDAWLRKVKSDTLREAAIKAQESFIAEQGGIGYARVRTSWLFDEADRIQG